MATLHMDKYSRLISINNIPTLWTLSGPLGYANFEYSQVDNGNILPVMTALWGEDNQQDFDELEAFNASSLFYPPEWVYQMMWYFYRAKNATLLRCFSMINGPEFGLKSVRVCIKSAAGTDTGNWGTGASAVLTLGEQTYTLSASGQNVVTIANSLKNLLNNNGSLRATASGNLLTVDLGARESDFTVDCSVTNATALESIIFDPTYGAEDDPGKVYGTVWKRFSADQRLSEIVQIGATRELDDEALPELDTEDTDPPDLVIVMRPVTTSQTDGMVWSHTNYLTFYTVKLRDLLTATNTNNQQYSVYREYQLAVGKWTKYDFEYLKPLGDWITYDSADGLITRQRGAPLVPNQVPWRTLVNTTVQTYPEMEEALNNAWGIFSDTLVGVWGFTWQLNNSVIEPEGAYSNPDYLSKQWLLNNFTISLTGESLSLVEGNGTDTTISIVAQSRTVRTDGIWGEPTVIYQRSSAVWQSKLLVGEDVLPGSILIIPSDNSTNIHAWHGELAPFPRLVSEKPDPIPLNSLYDWHSYVDKIGNTAVPLYYNTGWEHAENSESFTAGGQTKYFTVFKLVLNVTNTEVFVGRFPYSVWPFVANPAISSNPYYDENGIGACEALPSEMNINIPFYGVLLSKTFERTSTEVTSQVTKSEVRANISQFLRVGDLPTVAGNVVAIIDTTRPGTLCYTKLSLWKSNATALSQKILTLLETVAQTPAVLGQPFLDETVSQNTIPYDLEQWQADIEVGTYCYNTPKQRELWQEWEWIHNTATAFNAEVTQLVHTHDALVARPEQELQRLAILAEIEQLAGNYVKAHYQVLFNNFASTELIEVLTLNYNVYFIIPQF